MNKLLMLLLVATTSHSFAQEWPVKKMVMAAKANKVSFTSIPAFSFVANKILSSRGTYQQLRLNTSFSKQVMEQRPDAITINIPLSNKQSITCDLVKFNMGNVKFTENNDGVIENVKIPVTYRGIVNDEQNKNIVTLTVNENYLGLVATMTDKVIQLTKADEANSIDYRLYNSSIVEFPSVPFNCGTKEKPVSQTELGIDITGGSTPTTVQEKCVNVFVDCSDSMFKWRSSNQQQVINYVYELFNSIATGYFNDSVNVQITTINVWTKASPFVAATRETALAQLAAYWKDNFFGNICVGLDYGTNGRSGIAGGIGRVKATSTNTCPAYNYSGTDSLSACCYNDLNYNVSVQNFPIGPNTTQQQVYLAMHEMGHLLGAHHTKWCGWKLTSNPDTYGTIDSCGKIEGSCIQGPPPPSNGATIMSYCVSGNTPNNYVGYFNGFGKLPGNAIRNFVDKSACILLCVDCFGSINNANNNNNYAYLKNTNPLTKNENEEDKGNTPYRKTQPSKNILIINSQKIRQ